MLKTLTLFCFVFTTITCYSQKTQTPITGIDAIKLGDSINRINTYGFKFKAVSKYTLTDSIKTTRLFEKKQLLLSNKAIIAKTKTDEIFLDSGKTFCPDVHVFIAQQFAISQLQLSKTASLALTYYKNKLIEIRIIDSSKRIRDSYAYGIIRYGKDFGKEFNAVKGYLDGRENATHPSYKTQVPKVNLSKMQLASICKQLSDDQYLERLYWENGNNTAAYNYCSDPIRFWLDKFITNKEEHYSWGCAEAAFIIRNQKAYKAMTACSDETLKQIIGK